MAEQIFVFFIATGSETCFNNHGAVTRSQIVTVCETMQAEGVTRSIIVLPTGLGPVADKYLRNIQAETNGIVNIETFREEELLVNITEHSLVPKHKIISKNAKKRLYYRYKVSKERLP